MNAPPWTGRGGNYELGVFAAVILAFRWVYKCPVGRYTNGKHRGDLGVHPGETLLEAGPHDAVALNTLGREGWELVDVSEGSYLFKRVLQER